MRILILLLMFMSPSFAQEAQDANTHGENINDVIERRPPLKPDQFRVVITRKGCARVIAHAPDRDVAYQAGVDVRGNSVVSADLPGSQIPIDILDNIKFDLPLNPFNYTGNANLENIFSNSSTNLGTVEYSISSGKFTLNGKALTADQQDIIANSCRAQGIVK